MTEYGIFHYSGENRYYRSSFSITVSNQDKLMDLGAKVIVLDGTADIHPDYADKKLTTLYEFGSLERRLDGLTIRFVDCTTGSSKLGQDAEYLEAILDHIETICPNKQETVIFSYKDIMPKIIARGY